MRDISKRIVALRSTDAGKGRGRTDRRATDTPGDPPRQDQLSGPWMNADQAAEHLALPSRKAVYEAVRRGEIPAYRLGRRLRFRREELDAALRKQRGCASLLDEISSEA